MNARVVRAANPPLEASRNVHELVDVGLERDLRPAILLSAFGRRVRRDRIDLAVTGRGERLGLRAVADEEVHDTQRPYLLSGIPLCGSILGW